MTAHYLGLSRGGSVKRVQQLVANSTALIGWANEKGRYLTGSVAGALKCTGRWFSINAADR